MDRRGFGQSVKTEGPYRYILTFTDQNILWEKQTWGPNSSKIPARVEHDQFAYAKVKSITYEEFDLGPTGLFNREHKIWRGWYVILTNGMRFPIPDEAKNGQIVSRIKEQVKLDSKSESLPGPTREVIKEFREVVLIQCRSCGARYQQGTPKCLTCGANL